MLELAFSILYDSSGQLNFIAPDKHEVSQVQSTETSLEPSELLYSSNQLYKNLRMVILAQSAGPSKPVSGLTTNWKQRDQYGSKTFCNFHAYPEPQKEHILYLYIIQHMGVQVQDQYFWSWDQKPTEIWTLKSEKEENLGRPHSFHRPCSPFPGVVKVSPGLVYPGGFLLCVHFGEL